MQTYLEEAGAALPIDKGGLRNKVSINNKEGQIGTYEGFGLRIQVVIVASSLRSKKIQQMR